jgi:hypothetical protein
LAIRQTPADRANHHLKRRPRLRPTTARRISHLRGTM